MATLLNEKKSTGGDPYAYYTVNATASDRTANDVKVVVEVISRLSSSQAFLGTGSTYGRDGYITLQGKEYKISLKATNERWSGTTKHKAYSGELTIEIEGSKSQIENIKFRVSPTGSASGNYNQAAALKSTSCNNLYIGIGHEKPSNVSFTITEKNQKLIDAGISNETFVNNLSIKEYNISATLHDGASVSNYNIVNRVYIDSSKVTPFQIDYSTSDILLWQETGKVPIRAIVDDNMNASGSSSSAANPNLYDYIPYTKIGLIETATNAKRNGQTSGKVKLNINGTYYNGSIGNITQTKPTIKYKYWKLGDAEPITFNNTIPSNSINVTGNNFVVNNYEIGSSVETATNYFNPELAYRVKIYVEDNFTNYTSQEKSIPVGEATWSEFKDRVDFKKITIKNKNEFFYEPGDTFECDYDTILNGYVTSGTKNVRLAFPVPKRLDNINSITIESLNAEARCNKGYLNSQSGNVEYVGKSGYTIGAHKSNNNVVNILIIKSSAWTNVDNNTPVVFVAGAGGIKLTFNSEEATTQINQLNMEGDIE